MRPDVAGDGRHPVNSRHHQAVDRVGSHLLVSARSVPDAVIEAVERAFHALASGSAIIPERLRLEVPAPGGVLLEMPSYLGPVDDKPGGALGTKIVSVFGGNAERGLDRVQAVYLLLDSVTGAPLALMEGRFITGIRTAATSALAATV